ncbi:hypothetical protein CERZMDRAFT_93049 [Cercospora zeae-maydis SCOH1-5]|uniref:Uncharacterized protein n=1 Tax=Cercospora zeae-maydis SCOH1-5 TaxID=717836 RepID=A0A6A6FU12_9PEZI|nr:hypothetical protein CERZMDRAFT_93049 [Cercospora zeae-maydis SCOH1-5]
MARLSVCVRERAQGVRSTYKPLNSQMLNTVPFSTRIPPPQCATAVPQEIAEHSQSFEIMSYIRLAPELPYGLPMKDLHQWYAVRRVAEDCPRAHIPATCVCPGFAERHGLELHDSDSQITEGNSSTPITTTPTTTTSSGDSSFCCSDYRPRSVYIPSSTSTLTTATTTTSSSGGRLSSSIASPTVPRRGCKQAHDYNYNIVAEALRRTYSKAKSHRQQSLQEKSSAKNRNSPHFVNSYRSSPRYRRDSMDIKAAYIDEKSSSQHHIVSDKASSLLYDHGAEDAAPVYDADPMAQRLAAPYIVSRKFFKQYDVRSTSNASAKNLDICQNGRPILFVNIKTPFWGVPRIEIVRALGNMGAGRGGPVVAAAKFKQIASGFYINIGNPPDVIPLEQWPQVSFSYWNETDYTFEFEGRRFAWKSPVSGIMDYLKDNGNFQLVDLENGTILAAYIRTNKSFTKDIARIEVMVELDQDLELMALTAIMGIDERKRRAMLGASYVAGAAAGAAGT